MSQAYDTAVRQANLLRQAAETCGANRSLVQAQISEVRAGLEGAAATALLEQLYAWRTECISVENELLAAAAAMDSGAQAILQSEIAARKAAEERAAAQRAAAEKAAAEKAAAEKAAAEKAAAEKEKAEKALADALKKAKGFLTGGRH